ncbi:hypothetical protein K488DRAFT_84763 [Vararia minispora EC-137]|uniref:Uncharacterized protein n=1 Tax=Vararia minispora EC-137 TaxID=1314806 RepID=A0ACB8QPE8_9AGAM|nr:hypothetical protein K488DRAFT_84763 [Vararia minispora EC-137]
MHIPRKARQISVSSPSSVPVPAAQEQTVRAIARIPDEIWVMSFKYLLPQEPPFSKPLDPLDWSSSTLTAMNGPNLNRHSVNAMRTLYSISLTSKSLHGPAMEVLYTIVFLRTEADATRLLRTLLAKPDLGQHTRHLVTAPLISLSPSYTEIVRYTPFLSSLSLRAQHPVKFHATQRRWLSCLATAIKASCAQSLYKIWLLGSWFLLGTELCNIMNSAPQLRSLITEGFLFEDGKVAPRLPSLEHLSFLRIGFGSSRSDIWPANTPAFPALTHLYIDIAQWVHEHTRYAALVARQGPITTAVTLNFCESAKRATESDIAALWNFLPNVTHIHCIIKCSSLEICSMQLRYAATFSNAAHLTLDCVDPPGIEAASHNKTQALVAIMRILLLVRFLSSSTSVRTLRLTHPNLVHWLQSVVAKALQTIGNQSSTGLERFRVEGPTGEALLIILESC